MRESQLACVPVSVVILASNEEANITPCLESVQWAGEVFVVDSWSTDKTVEIARALGAKVCAHTFASFASQRNWALDNLPFSFEWVLMLDADEVIPPETATALAKVVTEPNNPYQGFYLNRRLFFWGRWLRHGGIYPSWILRLLKRGKVTFEDRPLSEYAVVGGPVGRIREPFDHLDHRPLSHWIKKHNRYADLRVEEFFSELRGQCHTVSRPRLFGSQAERKRWLRVRIWDRLPLFLRPFLFFFRSYVLRLGFLDGLPGFVYHVLLSFWFPFLIDAKMIERQIRERNPRAMAGSKRTGADSLQTSETACRISLE
jgi:glycosyltransferase involved in cell wall biosynthesis